MPDQPSTAPQHAAATDFLNHLREQTAPAHEHLESHPLSRSITSPAVPAADYRRYLQVMQRVVQGLEEILDPILHPLLPDAGGRGKQAWLHEDLGSDAGAENPFPPFSFSGSENGAAYALGALYVLEGSTLGGRVILKSLPTGLSAGTRYFEGYGAQTGTMWKSFLASLCAAASTPEAEQSIINGATDTFAAINRYFNTILAHEATGHRQS